MPRHVPRCGRGGRPALSGPRLCMSSCLTEAHSQTELHEPWHTPCCWAPTGNLVREFGGLSPWLP